MPKRKANAAAPASFTGLIGSDDEDPMMQIPETQEPRDVERPTKKQRGRPRSKSGDGKPLPVQTKRSSVAAAAPEEPEPVSTRRTTRRGRPKGSRNSSQAVPDEIPGTQVEQLEDNGEHPPAESAAVSQDELDAPQRGAQSSSRSAAAPAKPKSGRGRRKGSSGKQVTADGEFEYTPAGTRQVKLPDPRKETEEKPKRSRRAPAKKVQEAPVPAEEAEAAPEVVEETMIEEEEDVPPPRRSVSASPTKRRQSMQRPPSYSPLKRKVGTDEERSNGDPELRRRLGDLTKKFDALENRYRTLKEIGVVEANANVDKLRKQCEAISTASNNLVASLKSELDAQKALGQQSRGLQKQLKQRDAEAAQFRTEAEEAQGQLASAQTEVKALQTKLAAARNTAASIENAAAKAPGSAVKGGNNRAVAAVSAEAAQAATVAQLKEDLYSDLTGLIIRDVKQREADCLYDCIQTGVNGTLHFKLLVPHVSAANFENAEFQYLPLLDESRDRELVDLLPEYLTVDITFVRQQASKFYTRVIDALTKRRSSAGH
ncbi:putative chromosome segregation protein (Pcs1) [Aspergillus candidus]|uniref:Chromosome segregation protein Csm1/Pcs1-domain-containing protein n=1 Tax=Aspergillus candidus TaxID=41067 RepID=A0A2I2FMB0_ASPCN|nr:chromosome segregation protein Csm1/Pcs1-domain-containing protein [Aspergillus candidus]PLB41754.1 chromosome segregation protein Csm1/Pcs1-domain-containing protein [Aspergillus candidus]